MRSKPVEAREQKPGFYEKRFLCLIPGDRGQKPGFYAKRATQKPGFFAYQRLAIAA
ncbi:hypothetical protein [Microseira sp. BLCC-F43]|uniref:hypothetical protein n=1 Tax=Microseira sp. BLCC-F43 TaxID=3153602 RepID=UPI0035B6F70A